MYRLPHAVALIALTVGPLLAGTAITAQTPALNVPAAAEASPAFDSERATEAYVALVPPEQRARSDAYFEGSNWLQLWSSLYTIFILGLLLAFGWSSRMRELAVRITNRRPLQTLIYWVLFVLYVSVVSFPLTVYSGFYREHQYGLATQTFWPWMNEQLIGLAVLLILGGLGMIVLYAVLRRVGRAWWLWATSVVVVFQVFGAMIAPVFIAPSSTATRRSLIRGCANRFSEWRVRTGSTSMRSTWLINRARRRESARTLAGCWVRLASASTTICCGEPHWKKLRWSWATRWATTC
jgi:hypothetical protein